MTQLLKRLHIWVGLFNLTILIVFAVTGIAVTFPTEAPDVDVRTVPYEAPPGFTDAQVADDVFEHLNLPLTRPVPEAALRRNEAQQLEMSFHTPNGIFLVTVLEDERMLRVENHRRSLGEFINKAHSWTLRDAGQGLRSLLWALYVDLSIVSLLFMSATGVWLWFSSRPRLWWARLSLAGGAAMFVVLWFVTR